MVRRCVRRWTVTLVLIASLLAPASVWASAGAEPASPLGFWQSLQRLWLEWTVGWSGPQVDEVSAVRTEQAASKDEGGLLEVVPLDPPIDAQTLEGDGEDDEGDTSPKIDING